MSKKQEIAQLLIESAELLNEGIKSAKKHRMDNYLKKYNYKGDKKSGTIEVDGKTYNVDRDTKSKTMKVGDQTTIRQTAARLDSTDPTIYLDKSFERLKSKKKDAMLQHEIGHTKLHQHDPNARHLQKDRLNKIGITDSKKEIILQLKEQGYSDADAKNIADDFMKDKEAKFDSTVKSTSKTKVGESRDSNIEKLKKYSNNDKTHQSVSEFEADRYSSTRTSSSDLKRALREMYKNNKKNIKDRVKTEVKLVGENLNFDKDEMNDLKKESLKKENIDTLRKTQNIMAQNDMKSRSKALKDKTIDNKVYTESVTIVF